MQQQRENKFRSIFQNEESSLWQSDESKPTIPILHQGNVMIKFIDQWQEISLELRSQYLYKRVNNNQYLYCDLSKCFLKKFTFFDQTMPQHRNGIKITMLSQSEIFLISPKEEFKKWFTHFRRHCILEKFSQKFKIINKAKLNDPIFGQCHFNCIHNNNYKLVKILEKSTLTQQQLQCLCKEISNLRKLHNPFITFFNELYEDETNLYIIYDHFQGIDMRNWIKSNRMLLEERVVAETVFNLLQAVSHMHQKGVFHRDIKLDNIIIINELPQILLINFCHSENIQQDGVYKKCGTPGYIAPEIFRSRNYSSKVDVFSLGVVFYCLYFGKMPFSGTTQGEILQQNEACKANYSLKAEKHLCKKISSSGLSLLQQLMQQEPEQRITASQALQHHWFIKIGTKQQVKYHQNPKKGRSLSTILENSVDLTHTQLGQMPSKTILEGSIEREFTQDTLKDKLMRFNSLQLKPSKQRHQYYKQ